MVLLLVVFFVLFSFNAVLIVLLNGDSAYFFFAAPAVLLLASTAFFLSFRISAADLCPSEKFERFDSDEKLDTVIRQAARRIGFDPQRVVGVLVSHPSYNCGAFPLWDGKVMVWVTRPLFEMYTPEESELQLASQLVGATNPHLVRAGRREAVCYTINKYAIVGSVSMFVFAFASLLIRPMIFPVAFFPSVFLFLLLSNVYTKWRVRRLGIQRIKVADLLVVATCNNEPPINPQVLISSQLKLAEVASKRMGVMWSRRADPFAALTLTKAVRSMHMVDTFDVLDPSTTNSESKARALFRAEHVDAMLSGKGKLSYQATLVGAITLKDFHELSLLWVEPVPIQDLFKGNANLNYMQPVPLEGTSLLASRSSDTPQGWYDDPHGEEGLYRWWDGNNWTAYTTRNPQVELHTTANPSFPQGNEIATVAGWYDDPEGSPETFRWWDGKEWTRHVARRGDDILLTNPTRVMGNNRSDWPN